MLPIFSSQHACVTNRFPQLFELLAFGLAQEEGRNLSAGLAKSKRSKSFPRHGSTTLPADQIRLNRLKEERSDFGELERSETMDQNVKLPGARNKDGSRFRVPERCIKFLNVNAHIRMRRAGVNGFNDLFAIVVRAVQNCVHEALLVIAKKIKSLLEDPVLRQKVTERMPDRKIINGASPFRGDVQERRNGLGDEVFGKLFRVEALELRVQTIPFFGNTKSHERLQRKQQSTAQSQKLCTKHILLHRIGLSAFLKEETDGSSRSS